MDGPVKNTKCGHSYNQKAIEGYLKKSQHHGHGAVNCPVRSCQAKVQTSWLEPDEELEAGYERAMKLKTTKTPNSKRPSKKLKLQEDEEEEEAEEEEEEERKPRKPHAAGRSP